MSATNEFNVTNEQIDNVIARVSARMPNTVSNVSSFELNFKADKASFGGQTIEGLAGSIKATATDKNIEIQTNGALVFLKDLKIGDLAQLAITIIKDQEAAAEKRRQERHEADLEESKARTAKYEAEAAKFKAEMDAILHPKNEEK